MRASLLLRPPPVVENLQQAVQDTAVYNSRMVNLQVSSCVCVVHPWAELLLHLEMIASCCGGVNGWQRPKSGANCMFLNV